MSTQLWLRFTEHDLLDFVCRVFVPLRPVHTQWLAGKCCVYWSVISVRHRLQNMCHLLVKELSDWLLGLANGMWAQLLAQVVASWQESRWCLKVFLLPSSQFNIPSVEFHKYVWEKRSDISNNNSKGCFKPATTIYGFTLSLLTASMPLMTRCPQILRCTIGFAKSPISFGINVNIHSTGCTFFLAELVGCSRPGKNNLSSRNLLWVSTHSNCHFLGIRWVRG